MGLSDRVFNIAKGYLDKASERWQQIDNAAQQELDEYMDRSQANPSAWDRAQAKISALDSARELRDPADTPLAGEPPFGSSTLAPASTAAQQTPFADAPTPHAAAAPPGSTMEAAYRILGIPAGADLVTVRTAYQKLMERAAPQRFPDRSPEQLQAQHIERRASAAYMMLVDALSPSDDRFDRLEL
jgi:DnaJ-domain-containing protein 1